MRRSLGVGLGSQIPRRRRTGRRRCRTYTKGRGAPGRVGQRSLDCQVGSGESGVRTS